MRILLVASLALVFTAVAHGAGPLSPQDELRTFRILPGFRVELVACEPDIVDPVAMAFDERGRLFVAEMRGYPNGGVATGQQTGGRIRCLEDRDGDGRFETALTYADGLRFPTAVMPWRGGVIVGNAPDIIFCDDSGHRRVLYTGFALDNIQQLINSLQFGLDNWVHGCAGMKGGTIRSAQRPDMPAIELHGRGVRFRPDEPGSLQPTSSGGQYGLACDALGQWFTATNSQHLRHVVIPDEILRRNPFLTVPAVTHDIPDHGAACRVFRISPFEAWRVERTTRRVADPKFAHWPSEEKVPGGFVTSGCSPLIATADRFPAEFRGNSFVCDPANNLIHRDRLEPDGVTFIARRADADREFLASSDNWFRPVWLSLGPDGAIYVLDFYREAIETPISLPDDIKAKLNLQSRGRGRIWRIVPDNGLRPKTVALDRASPAELVQCLTDSNQWRRLTAQRLLIERHDKSAVRALEKLAQEGPTFVSRIHALWTLEGLQALSDSMLHAAIQDRDAPVREQALKLVAELGRVPAGDRQLIMNSAADASVRVRMQAAIAAAQLPVADRATLLATVLERDGGDPWMQSIVLSSACDVGVELLLAVATEARFVHKPFRETVLRRLASMVGAKGDRGEWQRVFQQIARPTSAGWPIEVLIGFGQAIQNSRLSFSELWQHPPDEFENLLAGLRPLFDHCVALADDSSANMAARQRAIQALAYAPLRVAVPALEHRLGPENPVELQVAAIRALASHDPAKSSGILLAHWPSFGPAQRREALEAICARPVGVRQLLDTVESGRILAAELEPSRRALLIDARDPKLRARSAALLQAGGSVKRAKAVADYRDALTLSGDAARGSAVFAKNCATCHRLGNVGHDVGADLRSALGNKTPEALLFDILDPNRDVDSRYVVYQAVTRSGRLLTGILAIETPASITLRRADGAEDTILRSQLESLTSTATSLMPEEFEKQLSRQELADLIAYLMSQKAGGKPSG